MPRRSVRKTTGPPTERTTRWMWVSVHTGMVAYTMGNASTRKMLVRNGLPPEFTRAAWTPRRVVIAAPRGAKGKRAGAGEKGGKRK